MGRVLAALNLYGMDIVLARQLRLGNQKINLHAVLPVLGIRPREEIQLSATGDKHLRNHT